MAQQIGAAHIAPQQVQMQPPVDTSWVESLDVIVLSRSKQHVSSQGFDGIRAECPIVNAAGGKVLTISYESTSRRMRQFTAQLKSADGRAILADFSRPALDATAGNMLFGGISELKPCTICVGGAHYATVSGNEVMNNSFLQKIGSADGLRIGKGPGCICCGPFKLRFEDFQGKTAATMTADNGSFCPCCPNTSQRRTLSLPSDQTAKLDALLMQLFLFVGQETIAPQ